jgi:hypothetical protein
MDILVLTDDDQNIDTSTVKFAKLESMQYDIRVSVDRFLFQLEHLLIL